MAIWVLRFILLALGVWFGLGGLDLAPAWLPPVHVANAVLGAFAVLALGILGATFAPTEHVRNLAVLAGWVLLMGVAALLGPGLVAQLR
jgi:hypothetical protein